MPDFESIFTHFVIYHPNDIKVRNIGTVPDNLDRAIDEIIAEAKLGSDYAWYRSISEVTSLEAKIYLAIPMPLKATHQKDSPHPTSAKVIVSNGGILVDRLSSEWLGEKKYRWETTPSSGVRGVRAILNFEAGTAPVTISRNELKISDPQANQVIDAIVLAISSAWKKFSIELFEKNRDATKTTLLLVRLLNRCCTPHSSGTNEEWTKSPRLVQTAVEILSEYGFVELSFQQADKEPVNRKLSSLVVEESKAVIAPSDLAESTLFHLFWSQKSDLPLIKLPDPRSCHLFSALCETWTTVTTEQDLWDVITIDESKDWMLRDAIPAEAAVVPQDYFKRSDVAISILPRKRARADVVVGLSRQKADNISPRVLMNQEHPVWVAVESRLKNREIDRQSVMDAMKLLFGLVVDEKAKGRRERELRQIKERISKLAGTEARSSLVVDY